MAFRNYHEKHQADLSVKRIAGVAAVANDLVVEAAFERSAVVDPNHITVDVSGSEVTLTGVVRSWVERDEANQAAWSAPGVTSVFDELAVRR